MKFTKSSTDKILTGVCGGLASDLNMPAYVLRIIFIVGTLISNGTGILIYICLALLMKTEKTKHQKTEEIVVDKEASDKPKKKMSLKNRNKIIAGVSTGLADYFKIDVVIIRLGFVFLALINGIGIIIYILLWILLPRENKNFQENENR